jgi:G3E family GTPase
MYRSSNANINHLPHHRGSAFPATLAFQIRELERDTSRALTLDAIVTVIDAENFSGYEDTSITARMQAQYTDVLLIVSRPPTPFPFPSDIFTDLPHPFKNE